MTPFDCFQRPGTIRERQDDKRPPALGLERRPEPNVSVTAKSGGGNLPRLQTPPCRSCFGAVLLAGVLGAAGLARASQHYTQSFNLQAGWNALWLEVEPTNPAPAAVFAGVPLLSVWTFQHRITSVDFIQDPSEPVWNREAWLVYVPTNRPESLDNNLFAILGGRAYLVRCSGPTTWSVTGRPVVRPLPWAAEAYNLRGFPVDPGARPTFRDFFRPSPAHYDAASGQLTAIYRLNSAGDWQRVSAGELMREGAAYWVFCRGASDYVAPLSLRLEAGDGLDFARTLDRMPVSLLNRSALPRLATLQELQRPQPATALAYRAFDTNAGVVWRDLPPLFVQPLEAGAAATVELALRRSALAGPAYESLLEVRDNAGTRFLLPVSARRHGAEAAPAAQGARHVGLWVGTISVDAVSEAHSGLLRTNARASDGAPLSVTRLGVNTNPTPTRSEFNLRLLLHVDAGGVVRLLREVTHLWQDGTYQTNAQGLLAVASPGRHVLVTDDRKLGAYQGATLRDGVPVGRRLSTTGFDFPVASPDQNFLVLSGTFAGGQTLSGTIVLPATHPTNPFRHKYHPDHDNLAADFRTFREEAYPVVRSFRLELAATDPSGSSAAADYGYNVMAGTYRETVTGLHREPIHARGTFRLRRVAEIPVLDP